MKSHTSLVAQQTRLSEWTELIRDCQSRPQGMKIDEWCQLHGITSHTAIFYPMKLHFCHLPVQAQTIQVLQYDAFFVLLT